MDRDTVPAEIRRKVLVEAGHRCAIPTCQATTTEIAHINSWAQSQDNSFENLIALCPNCHTRYDQKREIDRKAMQMYKRALRSNNQRFTLPFFLGDQKSELEIHKGPALTVNAWPYDCTVDRLLLQTLEGCGPVSCATILEVYLNGTSVFGRDPLRIDYETESSKASTVQYDLITSDWDEGSKVEFSFVQVGGGIGYQLNVSGIIRD